MVTPGFVVVQGDIAQKVVLFGFAAGCTASIRKCSFIGCEIIRAESIQGKTVENIVTE